jgi:hypothetical protein
MEGENAALVPDSYAVLPMPLPKDILGVSKSPKIVL